MAWGIKYIPILCQIGSWHYGFIFLPKHRDSSVEVIGKNLVYADQLYLPKRYLDILGSPIGRDKSKDPPFELCLGGDIPHQHELYYIAQTTWPFQSGHYNRYEKLHNLMK